MGAPPKGEARFNCTGWTTRKLALSTWLPEPGVWGMTGKGFEVERLRLPGTEECRDWDRLSWENSEVWV